MEENKLLQEAKEKLMNKLGICRDTFEYDGAGGSERYISYSETEQAINEFLPEYSLLLERSKWLDPNLQLPDFAEQVLVYDLEIGSSPNSRPYKFMTCRVKTFDFKVVAKYHDQHGFRGALYILKWQPLPPNP